jgi:2-keto-4-pentenoate hydratase/2-oxohepta-3-ene-1,7-dioic acid hydratase in catechol pathway
MKRYVRVNEPSGPTYAEVTGDELVLLSSAPWDGGAPTGGRVAHAAAALLAPLEPSKILGIGRNYRAHAAEIGHDVPKEPLLFLKPPSALLASGGAVLLPPESRRVDYEAELGVVIGKRCRRVARERALDYVFGYTVVCDVTARDLQRSDGQWTRAKGFDTFCPVGPEVATGLDPAVLDIELAIGGEVRQRGNTRDMIFDVARLVAHASSVMTLEPGDLIATGTPHGVGPLGPGDRVAVRVAGLAALEFSVARDACKSARS